MIDTVGDPTNPAVLLIGGMSASMDWWEPEFCAALAEGGRYVIRYDHRDTGEAESHPPGRPGYTGRDLMNDALAVLDRLGIDSAHLVGMSMGGAIAQELALYHPERVRSLTAIATSASGEDPDLPGSDPMPPAPPEPDWTDDAAVVDHLVAAQRIWAAEPFDEAEVREIATKAVSRTKNNESSQKNHAAADSGGLGPWRHRLGEINVPTVVIHGEADPLFPLPHGEALARAIPGARLVVLPNTGHEFPRRNWPLVIPAILAVTS